MLPKMKHSALLLSLTLSWTMTAHAGCGSQLNATIQNFINKTRVMYQIPGIQVSVSCPGEITPRDFVSGTTTLGGTVPLRPDHLFQIGSETKPFTATLILQLEAEGKLSIYDPISSYLKNIPVSWQAITIQQLLSHTSGIMSYLDTVEFQTAAKNNMSKQWTADELVSQVVNKNLLYTAGLGWNYSHTNYVLLGKIIETVTGNTYGAELDTRILRPLHLANTHYLPSSYDSNTLQQMAHGYSAAGFFPDEPKDITTLSMSAGSTAGAIVSTTHDKVIWLRHLLTTNNILPEIQKHELMRLVDLQTGQILPLNSTKIGYGDGMMGMYASPYGQVWGHGGRTLGYSSVTSWLKCNDIVFSTNFSKVSKADIDGAQSRFINIQLMALIQQADTGKKCSSVGLKPIDMPNVMFDFYTPIT